MTTSEIVALASVLVSVGMNVALYIHLSNSVTSAMNARFDAVDKRFDAVDRRFDSVERRLELIQGDAHNMDIRLSKLEK